MIKRHGKTDITIEKKITTAFIVSRRFCRDISQVYRPDFIKLDYARKIIDWCIEFYQKQDDAPGLSITDIYDLYKDSLDDSVSDLVSSFLLELSETYEEGDYSNEGFIVDEAFKYFEARSLEILSDRIKTAVTVGKIDRAKDELAHFHKVDRVVSQWFNPLDKQEIISTFEDIEKDRLFRMPGVIGDFLGDFSRGQVFGIIGPMKRGKSFWIDEILFQGALTKKRVAKISFEMNKTQQKYRFYKRMTALAENGGAFNYPIFDCLRNQEDSCSLKKRACNFGVINEEGFKAKFDPKSKYKPCDACRGDGTNRFIPDVWWEEVARGELTPTSIIKKVDLFTKYFGDRIRYLSYPSFSAGVDQMDRDLDLLYQQDGFVPDLIGWDYPNITKGDERKDPLWNTNMKWQFAKRMAEERHCLVIPAHQGNRSSVTKKNMAQGDVSEDIRILAHVDGLMALNQTEWEKTQGIMRLSLLAAREVEFGNQKQVIVLYKPELGQTNLDSEWLIRQKQGG
jgi:hypothetical protein